MSQKKYYSMSFWIKIILLLVIIPSLVAVIYVNSQMRESLRRQSASVNSDILEFYIEQIDSALENADIYLANMLYNNVYIVNLQMETDKNDRQLIKYALHEDLVSSTVNQAKMDGFFVYSYSPLMDDDFFNCVNNTQSHGAEKLNSKQILDKIQVEIEESSMDTRRWFCWKMGDEYYLFRIMYDRNTYLGCWVGLNSLIQPLERINMGRDGFSVITSLRGDILTENPTDITMLDIQEEIRDTRNYIQVSTVSQRAEFCLVAMIPEKNVLAGYSHVQSVLFVLSLIIVLLLPLAAFLVSRFIYRPLNILTHTMERIKQGDTELRMISVSRFNEFHMLCLRFNEMLDELHNTKLQMYERQLKEKETYLQYLQLQIHPHFFLNCMSLMHGLAELEKYREIQKLSKYLVKYFRYMFKKATALITVREEAEHIKNYMEIQKMRFPDGIEYYMDIDENAMDAMLPPLSIQTFVENSVKYALDLTKKTRIDVQVRILGIFLKVSVRDNGRGFPVDVLTVINSETDTLENNRGDGETHHIGIRNVRERLTLIFGKESYMRFYNDKGSVVEYVIPIVDKEEHDV